MTKYIKAVGLAAVASVLMMAAVASSASAAQFTSEVSSTTISADQTVDHVLSAAGGTVTCDIAEFHGTQAGTSAEEVTIAPSYDDCTAFGLLNATVTTTGCVYKIKASGKVDLSCETGKEITIVALTCTIHIGSQTGLGNITYATGTSNSKHDLTATINVTGIKGNSTSGLFCPATNGAFTNGALTGTSTVTGTNTAGGAAVHITHDA